jgi:hypothetical protein
MTQYPSKDFRVYAVWLPMLWTDSRGMWDGNNLSDSRVLHYWDGERVIGRWFARNIDGYDGISWDAYYLYGPDATWKTRPSPLLGSGGTIYSERTMLMMKVSSLLKK